MQKKIYARFIEKNRVYTSKSKSIFFLFFVAEIKNEEDASGWLKSHTTPIVQKLILSSMNNMDIISRSYVKNRKIKMP